MAVLSGPLYLGLISGTSADAIDAALTSFDPAPCLQAALAHPYPSVLRERVLRLGRAQASASLDELGMLDVAIGHAFADAALALLREAGVRPHQVRAIGSHGQTVRHRIEGAAPFTLQLGDANVIAERCGVDVVADFRRRDVAAGGHGTPLVPAFHAALLAPATGTRVVLNLGGIANVTVLHADGRVTGFDTGPANCLLDAWSMRHRGTARDDGGAWAAQGRIMPDLLAALLREPYFAAAPPKSTGRELFNLDWLDTQSLAGLAPADVQATLVQLTARSVADAIRTHAPGVTDVLACGGGVHNPIVMHALCEALAPLPLASTAARGIDPDFVEAMAFAWLAQRRLAGLPGNVAAVTGAAGPRVLGAVYFGGSSS